MVINGYTEMAITESNRGVQTHNAFEMRWFEIDAIFSAPSPISPYKEQIEEKIFFINLLYYYNYYH
jgi:hypothetical protein